MQKGQYSFHPCLKLFKDGQSALRFLGETPHGKRGLKVQPLAFSLNAPRGIKNYPYPCNAWLKRDTVPFKRLHLPDISERAYYKGFSLRLKERKKSLVANQWISPLSDECLNAKSNSGLQRGWRECKKLRYLREHSKGRRREVYVVVSRHWAPLQ